MPIISVKFYNFGTSILWTKNFARSLPKYRGFTVYTCSFYVFIDMYFIPGN